MKKSWIIACLMLLGLQNYGQASEYGWMPHLSPEQVQVLQPEMQLLDQLRALDLRGSPRAPLLAVLDDLVKMKQLRALDLSQCDLLIVPDTLLQMQQLRRLNLSDNKLEQVPQALFSRLPELQMLDLSYNSIQQIPDEFVALSRLVRLDLQSNQLATLPDDLKGLTALAYLDISWNRLHRLPEQLYALPALRCLLAKPNPYDAPPDDARLRGLNDCSGQRVGLPVRQASPASPAHKTLDRLEAKSRLLTHLIQDMIKANRHFRFSMDDLRRYETKKKLTGLRGTVENRFTFFNYLLQVFDQTTPPAASDLFNAFDTYAQQNWISVASSAEPDEGSETFVTQHQQRVFAWQLFSSKVIFWTVILIVICGLAFSALQFYASFKTPAAEPNNARMPIDETPGNRQTEIEISPQSLKVRTSVMGVIILTLSLSFFYLYLKFVYPVQPVSLSP